jgi:halimadienyl-diphosphate synthase
MTVTTSKATGRDSLNDRTARASVSPRGRGEPIDVTAAADDLVRSLVSRSWGQVSPSVYETGRLVTLSPWLTGHARRIEFLLDTQGPDGTWGGPEAYALVPTLSATEALLMSMRRVGAGTTQAEPGAISNQGLVDATNRGLRRLFSWLRDGPDLVIPDTPAVELIVPALVELVNKHLDEIGDQPVTGLDGWRTPGRLLLPASLNDSSLASIRESLQAGDGVPHKFLHSLEVAGRAACGARSVIPVDLGNVGASPAATAAWLGDRARWCADDSAVRYLEEVVAVHGGPVPSVIPITMFERAWVLAGLAGAGVDLTIPADLTAQLKATLGTTGTPGGAGLPPDADTTAVTLVALTLLGAQTEPDTLWAYETETHFCTWHGERTPSTSLNAHVLEALGLSTVGHPLARKRREAATKKLTAWLHGQQLPDGSWLDKWHASPYYATACCALALERFGGEGSSAAVSKAVRWVLTTQRFDGSWGQWRGTVEETAYAIQVLLRVSSVGHARAEQAAARGYVYLLRSADADDPPLWHDKDLYRPSAVVQAATIGAAHLAQSNPAVVALARGLDVRRTS